MIHPTAIVSAQADIAADVEIGPYCLVGDGVSIGEGSVLKSHVVIEGQTEIGRENTFFPFASIGLQTQDLKFKGGPTYLKIGDRNTFRESCTVHSSTFPDTLTSIGNDNYFLCYSHVAHECRVMNHCIFSNNASLAGHVEVADHVILSGFTGVHQFCRIGAHSIVGGCTKIVQDVPPFMIIDGNPASVRGVNKVGLERRHFAEADIKALRVAYKKLFLKKDQNLTLAMENFAENDAASNPKVTELISFLKASERGLTR